jgi:hypothetical protein
MSSESLFGLKINEKKHPLKKESCCYWGRV